VAAAAAPLREGGQAAGEADLAAAAAGLQAVAAPAAAAVVVAAQCARSDTRQASAGASALASVAVAAHVRTGMTVTAVAHTPGAWAAEALHGHKRLAACPGPAAAGALARAQRSATAEQARGSPLKIARKKRKIRSHKCGREWTSVMVTTGPSGRRAAPASSAAGRPAAGARRSSASDAGMVRMRRIKWTAVLVAVVVAAAAAATTVQAATGTGRWRAALGGHRHGATRVTIEDDSEAASYSSDDDGGFAWRSVGAGKVRARVRGVGGTAGTNARRSCRRACLRA
jgi:hypothetical protein